MNFILFAYFKNIKYLLSIAGKTPQGYVVQRSHYHIKKLDEIKKTCDFGISAVFEVTNVSSRSDRRPELSQNRYYGYLEDIIDCDFKSFKIILFVVKWYKLRLNRFDTDRTVIEHDNGFTMVNTRSLESRTSEPYVLPSQCEHVFYSKVPGR